MQGVTYFVRDIILVPTDLAENCAFLGPKLFHAQNITFTV